MGAHVWKRDAGTYTVGVVNQASNKRPERSGGAPPAHGSSAAGVNTNSSNPPAKRARVDPDATKQSSGLPTASTALPSQKCQQQEALSNSHRETGQWAPYPGSGPALCCLKEAVRCE
jgi:hypothetical protein